VRIRRLQIKDFRRYRDLDVDFAPGLTVVRGPNEAGKTTIQRAIELAITRRATSGANDLNALRPWDAAADARTVISIEFEQDEDEVVKTGSLEKVFGGTKGTVKLVYDGQTITDPTLSDQVVAELSGIPTEAFFRSTASVRHHELADLARDEAALRDRLQASISGADRGTSRAKRKLERAIFDLATKGDKNPGRLKVAETALAEATASLDRGEAALAQLEADRDTLSGSRERRVDSETALAERRSMLEKARQAERLTAERTAAQERFERYREASEVSRTLTALADSHPSANPLPVLRKVIERLRGLDTRVRELKAALAGEIEVTFEIPPEPTWRPLSRIAIILVVAGALVAGGVFVARAFLSIEIPSELQLIGFGAAIVGLILAAVALWLRRSDKLQQQLRDIDIDRRLRGRSDMEQELRETEAEVARELETLGLEDVTAAEDLLTREEEHVQRVGQLEAQLKGLIGTEPVASLPKARDAAALDIEQKTHALEALGPIAKEPRARERLEVEVREQETALERARDDEANARARVEANNVDAEQVAASAERVAGWNEELAALQRRERVYVATLEAIERAEQATMKSATRYLEQRMVRDIAAVTDGRYRRVRVDDKTLDIEVFAPERDDWVPVSALSQGTLDIVYLAARLGLVRLVTGDRRPPLVFDDPFVTLDDARAGHALALLRRVADDFQVIYLTTSSRYDEAADAIVELPGPTAVDEHPLDDGLDTVAASAEGAPA
jgi:DNA repair exonuclease SbcCD ATPase subunit